MDYLRRCIFRPYRKGAGLVFTLTLSDTYRRDHRGKSILAYRLTMSDTKSRVVLFAGSDFACSPCHAIDSDEVVSDLMGFLTLRPGDTDDAYFAAYSPLQLDYCATYAEALSAEVESRFPSKL